MKKLEWLQLFLWILILSGIIGALEFAHFTTSRFDPGVGNALAWQQGYPAGTYTFGAIACTAILAMVWIEVTKLKR